MVFGKKSEYLYTIKIYFNKHTNYCYETSKLIRDNVYNEEQWIFFTIKFSFCVIVVWPWAPGVKQWK